LETIVFHPIAIVEAVVFLPPAGDVCCCVKSQSEYYKDQRL